MMNVMLQILLLSLPALFASDKFTMNRELVDSHPVVVTGTVIGYSRLAALRSISGHSISWPHDVLLVRVDNESAELRKGQYIKASYKATSEHHEDLPQAMVGRNSRWQFELTRDKSCDESMRHFIYGEGFKGFEEEAKRFPDLLRVKGTEDERLPEDATLTCYNFHWGNYKELD